MVFIVKGIRLKLRLRKKVKIEISSEPVTARRNDVVGEEVIIHFFNTLFCWNDISTSVITICTGNISR